MDDLTFRRTLYADPHTQDPNAALAAKGDAQKQAFWKEMKAFDSDIKAALSIDVPENLAEKLLLKQTINIESNERAKRPWYWAMAATVALAAVLSFALITPNAGSISYDALAHATHAEREAGDFATMDMATVNAKLASYNGTMHDGIGEVLSANFCYLDEIKTLHLIVKGEKGLLSLFVLPEEHNTRAESKFSNHEYSGLSFLLESTRLIVVGEDASEIESFSERAKKTLLFSA